MTCDTIVRIYAQICHNCEEPCVAQPEKKAFSHVIEKMVNDIVAFYVDMQVVPQARPLILGRHRANSDPHDFKRCIACLQGACVKTWRSQAPDFEIERLVDIYQRQRDSHSTAIPISNEILKRIQDLHDVVVPEQSSTSETSDSTARLAKLGIPNKKEAICQFLAILRRHIDWSKVEFKNYLDY